MPVIDGGVQPFALTLDKFLIHAAKWHPLAEVVTKSATGHTRRTGYAKIAERSRRISAALKRCDVKLGDRVATLAWNTQAHVEVFYAIMGMGAICLTLNPRLISSQLAAMVLQSEARIIVVSADLSAQAQDIARRAGVLERVLIIDAAAPIESASGMEELESLLKTTVAAEEFVWGNFEETAPSGLCFTSGTTGAPKGVTYTHRSSFLHTLRLLQTDVMAISRRDSVLVVVPMFHANAWGLPFAVPAVGATLVLPGRDADGASLARLIASEAVTIAVGVPTVWLGLLEHLDATGGHLPTLKRIVVGGAPLAPTLMERIEQRLGVVVQTSWGMTELSPSGTVSSPHESSRAATSSGRPAVGVDLLITDADGHALPEQRNSEGHLRVRGAAVVERYFGDTQPVTGPDGWFSTGDLARISPDGNLIIVGRSKDLIKSGAEWINPAEIEALISALHEVALAAVIGRVDQKWGERPVLVVEIRRGLSISDEALLAPLKGRVPPWWIPDAVIRVFPMPLASTGKIDKMSLRAKYSDEA